MKRRFLSILLTICMLVPMFPTKAWAAEAGQDLYPVMPVTNGAWSGSGTESDPYQIEDAADLKLLATNVNDGTSYENTYFKLAKDIDLNNERWTPIGVSFFDYNTNAIIYNYFSGTFDGDNKTVSGLYFYYTSSDHPINNQGLFGYVDSTGTIKNLTVSGTTVYVDSGNSLGGVVGYNSGTVKNCSNTGKVEGGTCVGGVVGYNSDSGTVTNCYNTGTVKSPNPYTNNPSVGGVVGYNSGTVESCYFQTDGNLKDIGFDKGTGTSTVTAKSADDFTSGEVAWLLQDGQDSQNPQVWGQTLTGSEKDGHYDGTEKDRPC